MAERDDLVRVALSVRVTGEGREVYAERLADAILAQWVPEHDRKIQAETWNKAIDAMWECIYKADEEGTRDIETPENPYDVK